MELNQLKTSGLHDTGAEMMVKDQFGNDTDFSITLVGVDSTKWREIKRQIERDAMSAAYGDESSKRGQAEYLADATIGWSGLMDDGKDVKFSKDKAKQLYESAPYIADQADRFIANRLNFMQPDSKT